MKKIYLSILILIIICAAVQASNPGTTSANFLKLGVGARSSALGRAYTAVNKDINSLYWNPAGIAGINSLTITGMHNNWVEDINYNFVGAVVPFKKWMLGLSGSMLSMDDIDKTIEILGGGYQTIGTFSPKDYSISFTAAKQIKENINLGLSLKYISSKLDNQSANAFALDLGLIYKPDVKNLQFGLSIKNIGTKLKYINEKEKLPLSITIGGQYKINNNIIVLADLNKYTDNDIKFHSGVEYNFNILSLRAGYNSLTDIGNGFTCGIGIKYKQFVFDYAFEPQDEFDDSQKFSMTYKF